MRSISLFVTSASSLSAGVILGASAYRLALQRRFVARRTRSSTRLSRLPSVSERPAIRDRARRHVAAALGVVGERVLPATDPGQIEAGVGEASAWEVVNGFVDRLAALDRSDWLAIGRAVIDDRAAAADRATARVFLEAIIADQHLAVSAWYVRDAVETMAFLARRGGSPMGYWDQRRFAAAHAAADTAALAVLAREQLAPVDFETLSAPFAVIAPTERAA